MTEADITSWHEESGDQSDIPQGTKPAPLTGVRRLVQIIVGVILVIGGIILSGPGIPGPGLLTIVVGLNMVKPDNRISRWIRHRFPGIPNEGPIPRKQIALGIVIMAVFVGITILWGPSITDWVLNLLGIDLTLPWQ